MKKIFLIIGIVSVLTNSSQASEWSSVADAYLGYNFYIDKTFSGENF